MNYRQATVAMPGRAPFKQTAKARLTAPGLNNKPPSGAPSLSGHGGAKALFYTDGLKFRVTGGQGISTTSVFHVPSCQFLFNPYAVTTLYF